MSEHTDRERRLMSREDRIRRAEAKLTEFRRTLELHKAGFTRTEIARLLSRGRRTVYRRLRLLGLLGDEINSPNGSRWRNE